jgi:hypothetical protein
VLPDQRFRDKGDEGKIYEYQIIGECINYSRSLVNNQIQTQAGPSLCRCAKVMKFWGLGNITGPRTISNRLT